MEIVLNCLKKCVVLLLPCNNYLNDSKFLLLIFAIFTDDVVIMSDIRRRKI